MPARSPGNAAIESVDRSKLLFAKLEAQPFRKTSEKLRHGRLPAANLTGPLILSAAAHLLGLTAAEVPGVVRIGRALRIRRSALIEGAVANLSRKLVEEFAVVALVCLVFLLHMRSALVAGQMALAVVLLIGAGLLVQSLAHLQRSDLDGYRELTKTLGLRR